VKRVTKAVAALVPVLQHLFKDDWRTVFNTFVEQPDGSIDNNGLGNQRQQLVVAMADRVKPRQLKQLVSLIKAARDAMCSIASHLGTKLHLAKAALIRNRTPDGGLKPTIQYPHNDYGLRLGYNGVAVVVAVERVTLWVYPCSHHAVQGLGEARTAAERAEALDWAPTTGWQRVTLEPGEVFVMHGHLIHAGDMGQPGESAVRLHLYMIPLEDTIMADKTFPIDSDLLEKIGFPGEKGQVELGPDLPEDPPVKRQVLRWTSWPLLAGEDSIEEDQLEAEGEGGPREEDGVEGEEESKGDECVEEDESEEDEPEEDGGADAGGGVDPCEAWPDTDLCEAGGSQPDEGSPVSPVGGGGSEAIDGAAGSKASDGVVGSKPGAAGGRPVGSRFTSILHQYHLTPSDVEQVAAEDAASNWSLMQSLTK
jgi:hypothetical protein